MIRGPAIRAGNPFPLPPIDVNAVFPPDAAYYALYEDAKPITKHSWNLSIQRQLATDWLVSGSYIGSQASHLWGNQERNPAVFIPGTCQAGQFGLTAAGPCSTTGNLNARRKLFLDYPNIRGTTMANISQYIDAGTQSYHGMLLSVQRRAASGVTVGANYRGRTATAMMPTCPVAAVQAALTPIPTIDGSTAVIARETGVTCSI